MLFGQQKHIQPPGKHLSNWHLTTRTWPWSDITRVWSWSDCFFGMKEWAWITLLHITSMTAAIHYVDSNLNMILEHSFSLKGKKTTKICLWSLLRHWYWKLSLQWRWQWFSTTQPVVWYKGHRVSHSHVRLPFELKLWSYTSLTFEIWHQKYVSVCASKVFVSYDKCAPKCLSDDC